MKRSLANETLEWQRREYLADCSKYFVVVGVLVGRTFRARQRDPIGERGVHSWGFFDLFAGPSLHTAELKTIATEPLLGARTW